MTDFEKCVQAGGYTATVQKGKGKYQRTCKLGKGKLTKSPVKSKKLTT